jgi:hypothetical protein
MRSVRRRSFVAFRVIGLRSLNERREQAEKATERPQQRRRRVRTIRTTTTTSRGRRSRGAVMVEAAVTMPVFMLLFFGVIEMSLLFRDHLSVANSTRDGARVAAAAGDDLDADYRILQTLKASSAVVTPTNIERIVVFKATGPGQEPSAVCKTGSPGVGDDCNVYTSTDFGRSASAFGCLTGTAADPDRNFCPAERPTAMSSIGYVGVWIKIKHPAVTAFFGGDRRLTNTMVMRIEPRRAA